MDQIQPKPVIKIIDLDRLKLWTNHPTLPNVNSKLSFGIRDGFPRITLFTNDPNERDAAGRLSCSFDIITFYTFIRLFKRIIMTDKDDSNKITCYTHTWENGVKVSNERVLQAILEFGKHNNKCYIKINYPNRDTGTFVFSGSIFHDILKTDGSLFSEGERSGLQAIDFLEVAADLYKEATVLYSIPVTIREGGLINPPIQKQDNVVFTPIDGIADYDISY